MNSIIHLLYKVCGHICCRTCLLFWNIRDFIFPPKEEALLIVAHPDDDTLFFHSFIKGYKPYVVLCTAGWSLRRFPCFIKAMRWYGVRYRVYDLQTRDTRIDLLNKIVQKSLSLGHFKICATHNATGEYGHEMHVRVHEAVSNNTKLPIMVPECDKRIADFPVDDISLSEKTYIFKNIYVTETWVLEQYSKWVENEKLTII